MVECIGRNEEKQILQRCMDSAEAEMVAVIGRRRVGKTFLVRSFFEGKIDFELTGIHNGGLREQLRNFWQRFSALPGAMATDRPPKNWLDAFHLLEQYLSSLQLGRKAMIFFDELPWLATPKSGFVRALENFWNSWCSKNKVVVVICGSAATWMLRKVVNNKGGLHNRISRLIRLSAFSLPESKAFLQSRGVALDHYQLLQLYMVTGGVPHYLKEVRPGQSAAQAIDEICFSKHGLLYDEFQNLYRSLYDHPRLHFAVVRELAKHRMGMTRHAIVDAMEASDGGSISRVLEELSSAGFIQTFKPFGKRKKDALIRLTDEYSLFYLAFIEGRMPSLPGTWIQLSQTQAWKSWAGYAFEGICIKHFLQIKRALGISGMYAEAASYHLSSKQHAQGLQIDMLIDRRDQVINLCEMKFSSGPYAIGKEEALRLRERQAIFAQHTKTKKMLQWVYITTFGILKNASSIGLVDLTVNADALFEEI